MLQPHVCLILLLLTTCSAQGNGGRCSPPGRCIQVYGCEPLAKLLKKGNRATPAEVQLLRNSFCGYEDHTPKVCCPSGNAPPITQSPVGNRVPGNNLPVDICGPSNQDRIVGGNRTSVFEFPWMARLGYRRRSGGAIVYKCGGSVITNRYILTAAHCAKKGDQPVSIRLGEHNVATDVDCSWLLDTKVCAPPVVDLDVESVVSHSEFTLRADNPKYLQNDIALIRVRQPIPFSDAIRPICLPEGQLQNLESPKRRKLIVAGWGKTQGFGPSSAELLKANVPVVPSAECARVFQKNSINVDGKSQLCAGGEKGVDSCNGDSGGPLTFFGLVQGSQRMVIYGIVSFGLNQCATEGVPGVYTRTSHFVPWIKSNMRP